MTKRLAPILLAVLALAGAAVAGAGVVNEFSIPALAEAIDTREPITVPEGMTVVFVPPAGDGFSDGGDGPGGWTWVLAESLPDGFSDGGDVPEGFVAAMAQRPGDDFWELGAVPEGLIPVLALIPPDGFSDGGDLPEGYDAVFFRADEGPAPEPEPGPDPDQNRSPGRSPGRRARTRPNKLLLSPTPQAGWRMDGRNSSRHPACPFRRSRKVSAAAAARTLECQPTAHVARNIEGSMSMSGTFRRSRKVSVAQRREPFGEAS